MPSRYDTLREQALCNAEALFDYWGLTYVKVNNKEYDFLNPTREDNNHGACRFNIDKGRGADFTGSDIKNSEIVKIFGSSFTREDFQGAGESESYTGFDIIGLAQRINKCVSYDAAARLLKQQLKELSKQTKLNKALPNAAELRKHKQQTEKLKILKSIERTWSVCKNFEGTVGDLYLRKRKIYIKDEPNIKYHGNIYNSEKKNFFPALIFKVSKEYGSPIEAIHRIYLDSITFDKLKVDIPKKALGSILGFGIWFGSPGDILCVAEGPENALSIRCLGYPFVVSTINSTNFHNLVIPSYIKTLRLFPDPDKAGNVALQKAISKYKRPGLEILVNFPPDKKLKNNKLADWNDILRGVE